MFLALLRMLTERRPLRTCIAGLCAALCFLAPAFTGWATVLFALLRMLAERGRWRTPVTGFRATLSLLAPAFA